ncbi:MAG TPA: vWA domain-containing protein [Pseudonocardia sp.]|nr:vWA domain-containing protein [Pseudonocardia sp.]
MLGAPGAAAQPALVVVPGGTANGQVRLLAQVPDGSGDLRSDAFSLSVRGMPQPARAEPVLSDRLAMALVIDASSAGSPVLPVRLGGAAGLVLAAPASTRSTVITDGTPPTVAVPWPSERADTLRGLSAVQPGGERNTAAALDLAVAQLPPDPAEPRLVVLATGAPDAEGEPASAIVERMRSAGVLLAVVGTEGGTPAGAAASEFWTTVAAGTGGVAVSAAPGDVLGAFDQVASALGRCYLLTFPAPDPLPATAVVRVETASGPLTSEVAVPSVPSVPSEPPARAGGGPGALVAVVVGVVVAALLAVGIVTLLRARARRNAARVRIPEQRRRSPPRPIWNVPVRAATPVDREPLLAELAATVHVGGPVWLRPDGGAAGLGVTTAMIDFLHRHRDRYDIAWWIPALDPDLVPDRMAELAEALGLAVTTDSADQATAKLLEALPRRHRWLLVLDDAGSPRGLARYLPDGPGDVLIASSDAAWRQLASPVTVPAFTRAESVALLRSARPDLAAEPADEIAAGLGDLPLAVGPAAALLADTDMDVDAFRALLLDRPADAPDRGGAEAVWTVTLDRLAADDPQAFALLTLVAWLGPAPMPLWLAAENAHQLPEPLAATVRDRSELAEHTALLRRRGLARVGADDVALHAVPAELLRARTDQDHPDDGGWTAIAVRLLRAAAPDRPAAEPGGWPTWRLLLPHVLAATDPARRLDIVADDVVWLLAQAGGYLAARGRADAARTLLDDAHRFDVGARLRAFGESSGLPAPEEKR